MNEWIAAGLDPLSQPALQSDNKALQNNAWNRQRLFREDWRDRPRLRGEEPGGSEVQQRGLPDRAQRGLCTRASMIRGNGGGGMSRRPWRRQRREAIACCGTIARPLSTVYDERRPTRVHALDGFRDASLALGLLLRAFTLGFLASTACRDPSHGDGRTDGSWIQIANLPETLQDICKCGQTYSTP